MQELVRYGVQPDWFELGDRDLATHLVRTQMLQAGYPLSQITEALCDRWQPGARLLPATDDRCETHVVITDPVDESRKAIHFQEWWVRYRAQVPTHSFAFVGAEKSSAATEAIAALADADIIMLAPSNPVVSIGAILAVPGFARRCGKQPHRSSATRRSSAKSRCAAWPIRAFRLSGWIPPRPLWAGTTARGAPPGYWTAGWCTTATTLRLTG